MNVQVLSAARRVASMAAILVLAACGASTEPGRATPVVRYAEVLRGPTLPAEMLMDWAEVTYPDYFAPAGTPTTYSSSYWYRYYRATRNYLGVLGNGVFVLGEFTANEIRQVGTAEDYECDALPETCWPGADTIPAVPAGFSVPTDKPFVIQTEDELKALWNARYPAGGPAPPTVDFSNYALVGGTATVEDHCAWLEVKRVLRQAGAYRLVWAFTVEPYVACTAEYAPYDAQVVLLVPKPVATVEFAQVFACPRPLPIRGHRMPAQVRATYELQYKASVDVAAESSRLAALYGLQFDHSLPGGVTVDIPAAKLPYVRCEPSVALLAHHWNW